MQSENLSPADHASAHISHTEVARYMGHKVRVEDNRTVSAAQRLVDSPHYRGPDAKAPHGYFRGRPIIGRNMPIKGGIYIGGVEREAITVDETPKEKEILDPVYSRLVDLKRLYGHYFPKVAVYTVNALVREAMRYDLKAVEKIAQKFSHDDAISICSFIASGVGVCRQMNVFAAYLLERLINDGHLKGAVSAERNCVVNVGAHAWVKFTDEKGNAYVIDPTNDYCGEMSGGPWPYDGDDTAQEELARFTVPRPEPAPQPAPAPEEEIRELERIRAMKAAGQKIKIPGEFEVCINVVRSCAESGNNLVVELGNLEGHEITKLHLRPHAPGGIIVEYEEPKKAGIAAKFALGQRPDAGGRCERVVNAGETIQIGRLTDSDIVIKDNLIVSGHHCRITVTADGKVKITDLGSRNGTLIS
jgi:hypothetical protein